MSSNILSTCLAKTVSIHHIEHTRQLYCGSREFHVLETHVLVRCREFHVLETHVLVRCREFHVLETHVLVRYFYIGVQVHLGKVQKYKHI